MTTIKKRYFVTTQHDHHLSPSSGWVDILSIPAAVQNELRHSNAVHTF